MVVVNVLIWFDTEDYITPASDEALLGLLNLLKSRNIPGIFKTVGERARVLRARGRNDVIAAFQHHEIGFHTNFHSVHPTVSEYLELFPFREGAYEFERREKQGLHDLHTITGMKSASYGQPGYSWGPQSFPTLKHWGIDVYLDAHDHVTLNGRPFWYGGLLNLTDLTGIMRMELEEGGLERAKHQFDELCNRLTAGDGNDGRFISIYYHPCEFSTTEFWDGVNFANGANPPQDQWKPATLRPPGEMAHYLQQLGEFLDYTLSKPDVRYITASETFGLERSSKAPLSRSDVRAIAQQVGRSLYFTVFNDHSLSASDLFRLFYQELLNREFPGDTLYGPEHHIESDDAGEVTVAQIKQALDTDYPQVYEFYQLPDVFEVGGRRVNPVDMACTMAYAIANGLSDEDQVSIVKGDLKSCTHVKDDTLWGPRWVIFPADLEVPNIVRLSKLQAWTLKPVLF